MVTKEAFTKICRIYGVTDELVANRLWNYQSEHGVEALYDAYPMLGLAVKSYEIGDSDGYMRGSKEVRTELEKNK